VTEHCGRSDQTRQARPVNSNHRQTREQGGRGPAHPVPRRTGASGQTPIGIVLDIELIERVARPVTVGALWTPTRRRVQRVRSNGEACPITTTALSDAHCYCLSCSDRMRPVTLIGASGHHVFHYVVR
jgi:hypothetical protein